MGNRAVITTLHNYHNNGVGVYLHWNGGRDSVESFLEYMKLRRHRPPDADNYGWARLCQVVGNFFGGTTSIGIDTIDHLDTNGDNGVYIIKGWDIVDRKEFGGSEQKDHNMADMLIAIDQSQPTGEQLGKEFLSAPPTSTCDLRIGDQVFVMDVSDRPEKYTVVGYGGAAPVNGTNVNGVPYVDMYTTYSDPSRNINNYLRKASYRVAKSSEMHSDSCGNSLLDQLCDSM